ncbi:MAG: hypothetical protein IJ262_08290 [Clostridia bacterium]|nr:hypothetical protein [Clostridia bacterium]
MSEVSFSREDLNIYQTICSALDMDNWNYEKDEEKLVVKTGARGDDLPMDLILRVNTKLKIVSLFSFLPVKFPKDKIVEGAVATCMATYGLADGSFDFDLSDGSVLFRLTSSYRESIISEEVIKYMLYVGASTIDEYNDRFLMLAKGMIDIDKFADSGNN